jgi:3-hydroxyisobutyrate dehydrogenase
MQATQRMTIATLPGEKNGPSSWVGFVGIGSQGGPIAERIALSEFPLKVWARRALAAEFLADAGATIVGDLSELENCRAVGVCVRDDQGVIEVCRKLIQILRPGAIIMVLSTALPVTCQMLAAEGQHRGVHLIDTPVSGGAEVARAGKITTMIGGAPETLAQVEPIIATYSELILHLGPVGSGEVAKIINNALLTANMETARLALESGKSFGLDARLLAQAIGASSGRSLGLETLASLPRLSAFGHGAVLLRKDVGLLRELGAASTPANALSEMGEAFLAEVDADERIATT